MGLVDIYAAAYFTWAVLFALTGGDLAAMTAALLGSSGLTAGVTFFVGIRKWRQAAAQQRIAGSAEMKTVAKDEVESAMRVMGELNMKLDNTNTRLESRIVECERRCTECQQNWADHRTICPLFGGPPNARP